MLTCYIVLSGHATLPSVCRSYNYKTGFPKFTDARCVQTYLIKIACNKFLVKPFVPITMAYFSDSPLEVIEQVIDALQEDPAALKACSQTCSSLLPLCRKYLFQSIQLTPRPWSPSQLPRLPRIIILFGRLLDSNPRIADYVQNLTYQTETPDFEDDDVPRVLERFRRVQFFRLVGVGV